MKTIKNLTKQTQNNLKKSSQNQNSICEVSSTDFEIEFTKLWVKLSAMYIQQKFSETMKGVNGAVARSWRAEFRKNAITPKEMEFMRDNLSLLKNPEFIPNSITMVSLCRKINSECRPQLGRTVNASDLPSEEEVLKQRECTESIRGECFSLINEILNREDKQRDDKPKSWINHIAPGPTDKMVRLIHNHNKILMSYGKHPLDFKQCKKRAFEMGLK